MEFPLSDEDDSWSAPPPIDNDPTNDVDHSELDDEQLHPEPEDQPPPSFPEQLNTLREALLGDYVLPPHPPIHSPYLSESLSASEMLTIKHYAAWYQSGGTVKAYKLHAKVLQDASHIEIQSLYLARKLAVQITGLVPNNVDICPRSCIAYTGEFAALDACPFVREREREPCGQARYKSRSPQSRSKLQPRAQMLTLPVMSTIKAMYSNFETAKLMRHRDRCLQSVLHLLATASGLVERTYSDYGDSDVHVFHHTDKNLFKDPRDVALAVSSDGAQLTMKKLSDTWLFIILIFNLPPEIRYLGGKAIFCFSTPGPLPPGNLESFVYPFFQEMAAASAGIWVYDAIDSSYFVLRASVVMCLGDMLGSAKLSGMAGHAAVHGDRFTMVKGARSSVKSGSKYQYYPINPPTAGDAAPYNVGRLSYDFFDLPYRDENSYWQTIHDLNMAKNPTARAKLVTRTGVSRLPLCAASMAFIHPTFFPLDPFHLFYENCMPHLWDMWVSASSQHEIIHLDREKASQFGSLVADAMITLPAKFCGLVRDPFLKRNSQYKIYEWMALLHWYIIPIGLELEFNLTVLTNFADFAEAIEIAMTIKPRTRNEIDALFQLIAKFLQEFEEIYVGNNPEKISRCRLCLFQLIHVPHHILWNGSVRVGSQSTVERAIGEVGRKVTSKKAPFAHLANIIHERELIKLLTLYMPTLNEAKPAKHLPAIRPFSKIKIRKKDLRSSLQLQEHLWLINMFLEVDTDPTDIERWGKISLRGKSTLCSQLGELGRDKVGRLSQYFKVSIPAKIRQIKFSPVLSDA